MRISEPYAEVTTGGLLFDLPTKNPIERYKIEELKIGDRVNCHSEKYGDFVGEIVIIYVNSAMVVNSLTRTIVGFHDIKKI